MKGWFWSSRKKRGELSERMRYNNSLSSFEKVSWNEKDTRIMDTFERYD